MDWSNFRKSKNSCDLTDQWNVPNWATASSSFPPTDDTVFPQTDLKFLDFYKKEVPICWESDSTRFGTAALLADKSPLTRKETGPLQCMIASNGTQIQYLSSILLTSFSYIFLLSRHVRGLKNDGTRLDPRDETQLPAATIEEITVHVPGRGIIQFRVKIDLDGTLSPALSEPRKFLDVTVGENNPTSHDFQIQQSGTNPGEFTLQSGSIELKINLQLHYDTYEAEKKTFRDNRRVVFAESQPENPFKFSEGDNARLISGRKTPSKVEILQRKSFDLPREKKSNDVWVSPGKLHLMILSDGTIATLYEMHNSTSQTSSLYFPDHQTGKITQVPLIDTGKGLVTPDEYNYGFIVVNKMGSSTTFNLVNRNTVEPQKINLQNELATLESETQKPNLSEEEKFIHSFRKELIEAFIGNEHLLSESTLLSDIVQKPGEKINVWRERVLEKIRLFSNSENFYKSPTSSYNDRQAHKTFTSNLINRIVEHFKLRTTLNLEELKPPAASDVNVLGRSFQTAESNPNALSLPVRAAPTAAQSLPEGPLKPPSSRMVERQTTDRLATPVEPREPKPPRSRKPAAVPSQPSQTEPLMITAFAALGQDESTGTITIKYLGNVESNPENHSFRLTVSDGSIIDLVVRRTLIVTRPTYDPVSASINGEDAQNFTRSDRIGGLNRLSLRSNNGSALLILDPLALDVFLSPARKTTRIRPADQLAVWKNSNPEAVCTEKTQLINPNTPLIPPTSQESGSICSLDYAPLLSFDMREETVRAVATAFKIYAGSIWDTSMDHHRGMSLDLITQTENHYLYQRARSPLKIEFDRVQSGETNFADVAHLKITYDNQEIPFEYFISNGRPYLFLKGPLQGGVYYLAAVNKRYEIIEATHPVIFEQAERDIGYTPPARSARIIYPKIRPDFLSRSANSLNPDEVIVFNQIQANRLGQLREAGVLPDDFTKWGTVASALIPNAASFNRHDKLTHPALYIFEEVAKQPNLREILKNILGKIDGSILPPEAKELYALYQKEGISVAEKTEQAFPILERLNEKLNIPRQEASALVAIGSGEERVCTPPISLEPSEELTPADFTPVDSEERLEKAKDKIAQKYGINRELLYLTSNFSGMPILESLHQPEGSDGTTFSTTYQREWFTLKVYYETKIIRGESRSVPTKAEATYRNQEGRQVTIPVKEEICYLQGRSYIALAGSFEGFVFYLDGFNHCREVSFHQLGEKIATLHGLEPLPYRPKTTTRYPTELESATMQAIDERLFLNYSLLNGIESCTPELPISYKVIQQIHEKEKALKNLIHKLMINDEMEKSEKIDSVISLVKGYPYHPDLQSWVLTLQESYREISQRGQQVSILWSFFNDFLKSELYFDHPDCKIAIETIANLSIAQLINEKTANLRNFAALRRAVDVRERARRKQMEEEMKKLMSER